MIYRSDHDGDGIYGTAGQMGLPSWMTIVEAGKAKGDYTKGASIVNPSLELWFSPCGRHPDSPGGFTTYDYWPSDDTGDPWDDAAKTYFEDTVLMSDFNCNLHSLNLGSSFVSKKGLAVNLGGSVYARTSLRTNSNTFWLP